MSFGTPSNDTAHGQYLAVLDHDNGQTIEIRSRFVAGPENLDPEDMDAAFSAAVAAVLADTDFTYAAGSKNYTTTEPYTP